MMIESIVFAGSLEDFNGASGIDGGELNTLIKALVFALISVGVSWVMVAGIRNWMQGQADMLGTLIVLLRAMLLVVAVTAIVALF